MKLTLVVAAHKPCSVPDFPPYLPVQAGAALRDGFGFKRDDTGDNISEKNPYYCELTALYWAWKNLGSDAVGLVHYRRLFGKKGAPLSGKDAERMLEGHDAILPKKRNYVISDLYSHYADAHGAETLDAAGEVIRELWPEYHAYAAQRAYVQYADNEKTGAGPLLRVAVFGTGRAGKAGADGRHERV